MAIGATGSFISEGAASDWGGVLLVEDIGTSPSVSASVFATFAVAMIISRFSADRFDVSRTHVGAFRLYVPRTSIMI